MADLIETATTVGEAGFDRAIDRWLSTLDVTYTAFTYPAATMFLEKRFLSAAAVFKTHAGRHFSVKKAVGEIVASVAAVFDRYRLAVSADRRFLVLAHSEFSAVTKALGKWTGGLYLGRREHPDGPARMIIYDAIIAEAWDLTILTHEFVHAMMGDTDAEARLREDLPRLELFTDCLAAEAAQLTTWREHYRGGDYIALARAEDPTFDAAAYIESALLSLNKKESAEVMP